MYDDLKDANCDFGLAGPSFQVETSFFFFWLFFQRSTKDGEASGGSHMRKA